MTTPRSQRCRDRHRFQVGKAGSQHVSSRTANSRQRVFVEVSRLLDPALVHTGIARYGRELLRHLPLVSDDDVWAVVQQPQSGWTNVARQRPPISLSWFGQLIGVEAHCSFAKALSTFEPLATHDKLHTSTCRCHLPRQPALQVGSSRCTTSCIFVDRIFTTRLGAPIQRSIDSLAQDDIALCDSGQTRADLAMVTEHPGNKMITVPLGCSVATTIAPARTRRRHLPCPTYASARAEAVLAALTQVLADRQREEGPTAVGHVFTQMLASKSLTRRRSAGIDPSLINVVANADDETIGAALAEQDIPLGIGVRGFGLPVLEAMAHGAVPVLHRTAHILR